MHKADESIALSDLEGLTAIYRTFIERYFAGANS
jgi:acetylornithine deacetylase/succinyl-diaminopimelate desuccinylase-like protein